MATVTINFVGICTHLCPPREGEPHRVVLVNAKHGDHHHGIRPHRATLITPDDVTRCTELPTLDGVAFSIVDAEPGCKYDLSYVDCVPHLQKYADQPIDIDPDVIDKKHREKTAAIFELPGGIFEARLTTSGATFVRVVVKTTSEHVTLRCTDFHTGTVGDIELPDGAIVQLQNIGGKSDDDNRDFLLHFRVAKQFPRHAHYPERRATGCVEAAVLCSSDTVGPGCSNSTYP